MAIKSVEVSDPLSCLSKAYDNERIFVLLARDVAAPIAIRAWCAERVRTGRNTWADAQIKEALLCAESMEDQQAEIRK